jgi:hypothetical protein
MITKKEQALRSARSLETFIFTKQWIASLRSQ